MQNTRILLVGAAFLALGIIAAIGPSYASSAAAPAGPRSAWQPPAAYAPDTTVESDDRLTAYVHGAMTTWAPEKHNDAFWRAIASDIAAVAVDAPYAILLASLAFHEGRFREYVDDQRCNDPAWRRTKEGIATMASGGDCDGSHAVSLWQIHPGEAKTTRATLRDRREAARTAQRIAMASLADHRGLCGYTGEPGPCPKGDERLDRALSYSRRHPWAPSPAAARP